MAPRPPRGQNLNRDPTGERGEINLYGFAANDPVNTIDLFGLFAKIDVIDCNIAITLPIKFTWDGATPEAQKKFKEGIEKKWTGKFGKWNVTTKVVIPSPGEEFNTIYVDKGWGRGMPKTWNMSGRWRENDSGDTAAHEIGHMMGLIDRYHGKIPVSDEGWKGNVMGIDDVTNVDERNINEALAVKFNKITKKGDCK